MSVQYIAHRGGSMLAPENTLSAFRGALKYPINAIELDVQMSSDGQIIVFHDTTVDRLTDGEGNILDLDFTYLRSLNAAAHFPGGWSECQFIPTLQEVFAAIRGQAQVYIEIKIIKRDHIYCRYPYIVESVVQEIRTMNMVDQVLVISFDWSALSEIKALLP